MLNIWQSFTTVQNTLIWYECPNRKSDFLKTTKMPNDGNLTSSINVLIFYTIISDYLFNNLSIFGILRCLLQNVWSCICACLTSCGGPSVWNMSSLSSGGIRSLTPNYWSPCPSWARYYTNVIYWAVRWYISYSRHNTTSALRYIFKDWNVYFYCSSVYELHWGCSKWVESEGVR